MSEPDNLVLRQLRLMDGKLDDIRERVGHLETRMTAQEQHLASLVVSLPSAFDQLQSLRARIERIERRLELIEPE
jgi:chromosome segregation ATPase